MPGWPIIAINPHYLYILNTIDPYHFPMGNSHIGTSLKRPTAVVGGRPGMEMSTYRRKSSGCDLIITKELGREYCDAK